MEIDGEKEEERGREIKHRTKAAYKRKAIEGFGKGTLRKEICVWLRLELT